MDIAPTSRLNQEGSPTISRNTNDRTVCRKLRGRCRIVDASILGHDLHGEDEKPFEESSVNFAKRKAAFCSLLMREARTPATVALGDSC